MDWALISPLPATANHPPKLFRDASTSLSSLPSTTLLDLTGRIIREGDYYSAHGGSADVWKGTWLKDTVKYTVAIKVVRTNNESENGHEKMNKRLRKEILVWHKLNHENILPLLGITFDFGRDKPMGMVCPWLENGNLNGYLDRCGAALAPCDRIRILREVAAGLSYLHSHHVVHGDLTGSNILLDGDLKVFLADFGLSNVVSEAGGPLYITSSIGGSVRWAAPECFRISGGSSVSPVTTHGDIYSYGGVMLQVLSGKLPYHHLRRDAEVLMELTQGVRPRRPSELTDAEHWSFMCRCWADRPGARPDVQEVFEYIQKRQRGPPAAADGQNVPSIPTSAEQIPLDNNFVFHHAPSLIASFVTTILSHIIP